MLRRQISTLAFRSLLACAPMVKRLTFGIALAVLICSNAASQDTAFPPEPPTMSPITAGALLGIWGVAMGAYAGLAINDDCSGSDVWCIPLGAALGAAALGTLGATIGAHLGNSRRGSFGRVLLISYATWGGGVAVAILAAHGGSGALALAAFALLPPVQLGVTVATERSTGRANERRHGERPRLGLFVSPALSGRTALGLQLGF